MTARAAVRVPRMPKWPSWAIVLAVLASIVLGGCTTVPKLGTILPPQGLLADCPEPQALFQTNGELASYALDLRTALRLCNNDKAALREWSDFKESP